LARAGGRLFSIIYDQRFSRLFVPEPSAGTVGRAIVWPRGRAGGSSPIDGFIFIRGQREDFDRGCVPHFRTLESFDGPPIQYCGAHGPLRVSPLRKRSSRLPRLGACGPRARLGRQRRL
jgi:choline dehydrogenase